MCLSANLSTLPKYLQSWLQFLELTITGERVRSGYGSGINGNEVHRGGRGLPRLFGHAPLHRILHTHHEHPRSYHCDARDGGARRSGDSSRGIRELGGRVSSPPLWSSPELALGHRDGHRRPRRGQHRRIRTPARDALSDLRDARVCSKGQLLGLSDPDARSDVHWPPAEASAVIAWHKEAAATHGIGRCWTMKIGMSLIRMKLKVGFSQDLLKTCTSVEPSSELDYCQIGMTAIVVGDVNTVYTLECAHRRQLLAALTLHERSLLIRGLPFLHTKTIGDVYISTIFSSSAFCNFQTCILIHRP